MKVKHIFIVLVLLQVSNSSWTMTRLAAWSRAQRTPRFWWQNRSFSTRSLIPYEKKEVPIKPNISVTEGTKIAEGGFLDTLKRFFWGKTISSTEGLSQGSVPISVPINENENKLFRLFTYEIEVHGKSSKKIMDDLAKEITQDGNQTLLNKRINGHSFLYWFVDPLIKDTLQEISIRAPFETLDVSNIYERITSTYQMFNLGARLDEKDIVSLRQDLLKFETEKLRWISGVFVALKYLKCIARCYKLYADLGIVNIADKGIVNVGKAIRFANLNMDNLLNDFELSSIKYKDNLFKKISAKHLDKTKIHDLIDQYSMLYKLNFLNKANDNFEKLFSEIKHSIDSYGGIIIEDVEMLIELALQSDRNMLNREINGHSLLFFTFEKMFDILWRSEIFDGQAKDNLMQAIRQLAGAGCYLNGNDKNTLRKYLSEIDHNQDTFYAKYPNDIPLKVLLRIARFYRFLLKFGVINVDDNSIVDVKKCIEFSEADIDDSLLKEKLSYIEKKDKNLYEKALFMNSLRDAIEKEKERVGKEEEQRKKESAERLQKWEEEFNKNKEILKGQKKEKTDGIPNLQKEAAEERRRTQTINE